MNIGAEKKTILLLSVCSLETNPTGSSKLNLKNCVSIIFSIKSKIKKKIEGDAINED